MTNSTLPPFPRLAAPSIQRLQSSTQEAHAHSLSSVSESEPEQSTNHIPGEPSVDLGHTSVYEFLSSGFNAPILDELHQHLWCVARRSGSNIDPLNRQRVKGRDVVAAEDPSLHLVWQRNKIYVKPMPLCLLNYDFWATYLTFPAKGNASNQPTPSLSGSSTQPMFDRRVALGFVRSYALLVRHRLDFVLARESHLFPEELDWIQWSTFIAHFRHIEDEDVADRYRYGQLRLTRLNWVVRFFRPLSAETRWFYTAPHWSLQLYLERVIAPLVFGFASLSLVLSSMQVLLSIPDDELGLVTGLASMKATFWIFSIMVLLLSGLTWAFLFGLPIGGLILQLTWGFKHRERVPSENCTASREENTVKV